MHGGHICRVLFGLDSAWIDSCAPSEYKKGLSRYGEFHYKDKSVAKLSYLYNGNSYTGKTDIFILSS